MDNIKINTLDIEASGIHPESYPIEIGIVLKNGNSWCSLIKPIDGWSLDSPWLIKLFHQARTRQDFKLLDIMYVVDEEQYESLNKKKPQIAQELSIHRHRASNDARILASL